MTVVTHKILVDNLRKGRRRGNWRTLSTNEKALLDASLAYTKQEKGKDKIHGQRKGRTIVEPRIVQMLEALFVKLLETRGMKIFKRGFEHAVRLLQGSSTIVWASSLPQWLKDPDFIFWLGAMRGKT